MPAGTPDVSGRAGRACHNRPLSRIPARFPTFLRSSTRCPSKPLNGANAPADAGPQFTVEKIYVKDVSFEAPGTPQVFNEAGQPQLQMNLNQRVQRLTTTRSKSCSA